MTIDEMNKTGFCSGMKAVYNGESFDIITVDFVEHLIGIGDSCDVESPIVWVRCESCEIKEV